MATSVGGTSEYNSDINVTPMVDVMLVLLIIFMIVTPLLQAGASVNLPREMISPDADEQITKDSSVVIAITKEGKFHIGKQDYPLTSLGDIIKRRMEGKADAKDRIVYLKADIEVPYGTVVEAIETIRAQDIDKVGLVADKKKGGGEPAAQ